jgi:hypothetical protein
LFFAEEREKERLFGFLWFYPLFFGDRT